MLNATQRREEKELKEAKRNEETKIYNHLSNVTIFRGSLSEYERWRGYECEILGPSYHPTRDNRCLLTEKDMEMYSKVVEAIVNAQDLFLRHDDFSGMLCHEPIGLPVKRKSLL